MQDWQIPGPFPRDLHRDHHFVVNTLIRYQVITGSMQKVPVLLIVAGMVILFTMVSPVSSASCGCSFTVPVKLPTLWDDNDKQWAPALSSMAPLNSSIPANQTVSQSTSTGSGKTGSTLLFKVSGTTFRKTSTKTAGLVPFNNH